MEESLELFAKQTVGFLTRKTRKAILRMNGCHNAPIDNENAVISCFLNRLISESILEISGETPESFAKILDRKPELLIV